MTEPGFWMNETSGVLRPAIEAYLFGHTMTPEHIAAMRAYLRQWINQGNWKPGRYLDELRATIDELTAREAIKEWLDRGIAWGIDPL